jgi:uncharacterized protein YndB with AHSA1/START domain
MKWVVLVVATILGIVLLVTVVGMMLPQSHVASITRHYDVQPAALWSLITSRERFPEWRSDLRSVQMLGDVDGKQRWKEQTKHDAITMEITEVVAGQRLVTRIADENLPFGGTWTFDVTPDGTGARLTITERGEVYNPIFRFVSRFVMGHNTTIKKYQEDAARALAKS